jgi:hypothetical protein
VNSDMKSEKIPGAHGAMVGRRMMFGEVICEFVSTASPVNEELTLFDAIFDPVKTHVRCFGSALFHCVVGNSGRASIIGLDWCSGLWMPHVMQNGAKHGGFVAIVEKGAELGLGGGRKNDGHDGGVNVDSAVDGWRRGSWRRSFERIAKWTAQEENTAGAQASFLFGEVGRVAVHMQIMALAWNRRTASG